MSKHLQCKRSTVCIKTLRMLALLFLTFFQINLMAQNRVIKGRVTDTNQQPLPGVNVLVKDTNQGTITDIEGNYQLSVSEDAQALLFSFVGYRRVEKEIANQTNINISLNQDATQLGEVVVTALGVKRETKALGYAVQEVKGEKLVQARETNLVSSLAGRIAGVNVTNGSSSIGGSSRIVIRGETSLTGDNQPLFVVDGVPITNGIKGSSQSGQEIDFGNAAAAINPDDIASISVLKGPNAAALYGSRAANGVILITTKSGKGAQGIGVSVNSNITFETPLKMPDFQNEYGQGRGGVYNIGDGGRSWGPPLDGRQMAVPVNTEWPPAEGEMVDWVPYPDNYKEFFETGRTLNNNISIAGSSDQGNFRFSYSNLDQIGIVPNTDQTRNNVSLNVGYNLSDRITANVTANYINTVSDNRPVISYGNESIVYTWIWEGRQVRTDKMRDYWVKGLEGVQPFTYNYRFNDNPYYTVYENLNSLDRERLMGNIMLNYQITDQLSLMLRSGLDLLVERRDSRRTPGSNAYRFGMYRQDNNNFKESNSDFLLTYENTTSPDFSMKISLGGNQMKQVREELSARANELNIPGIYNLGNSRVPLENIQYDSEYRINSLYAFGQFGYKEMLFLDLTARNDWSSTLPEDNNSYFYPSASISAIMTDMLNIPSSSVLSFAKLRAGWAQVGNDTDPYRLRNVYTYGTPWDGSPTVYESSTIANADLVPESINTFEIGTDLRFMNNRIGMDLTYYDIRSKNQILSIPIDLTSAYTRRSLNAGEIKNQGVEVMLSLSPLSNPEGLNWDINLNWSKNRSEVVELAEGIDTYELPSRYVSVQARVGEQMGDMYGRGFQRDTEGNIIHINGIPQLTDELIKVGNYNPDWMAGIYNTFTYKGFSLGALFDIRQGGDIYSYFYVRGNEAGQLAESLPGREEGYVGEGVMMNEAGNYVPNDVNVTAERYWGSGYFNPEQATFDASYVKLRELKLGYTLPDFLVNNTPFRNINLSLVGRNLFLWSNVPHIDPDTSSLHDGTILPGVESMSLPSVRSYGFNLSFSL
ncbi:TonB-linked SusC/RagA family outer membrane protein [Catalinimonas alkaloidigena]|nr:TonB-linked SusC/RagA family outer membrane protein [Catalinimonas alkaloidigena]